MATKRNIEQHLQEEKYIKSMYDFHDNCTAKNLFRNISKLVKTAKETYKEDLDIRRDRLRQLIELEEHGYEYEYRREVESRLENTIRQRQEMLLKIRNEKLKEQADFNKMRKAELIMNNSDQYRTMLHKENLLNTKTIQLIQIEEAKQKRLDEKQLECMWLDVQNRVNHNYDKNYEYENCLNKSINIKTKDYNLDKLKYSKIPIDMTSDYYEGFGSLFKTDNNIEQDKFMKRKENDVHNLMYNQKQNDIRKQKVCREIEIEELYNDECKREHLKSLEKLQDTKKANRNEIETYLGYVRQLKKTLDKEQINENELIMIEQMKTQCKEYEKYQKWKKQLEINAKKNHQILIQQIREHDSKKLDETILINEQHLADKELHRRQNCAEDLKEFHKKSKVLQLSDDLLKQAEQNRIRICLERQNDIEFTSRVQQYQDNMDSLAMKFANELKPTKIHPNMKLICPCNDTKH